MSTPLVVLDTMVAVSAIFSENAEGPSAAVVRVVATGDVRLAVSDDQLVELVCVMGYKGVEQRIAMELSHYGKLSALSQEQKAES